GPERPLVTYMLDHRTDLALPEPVKLGGEVIEGTPHLFVRDRDDVGRRRGPGRDEQGDKQDSKQRERRTHGWSSHVWVISIWPECIAGRPSWTTREATPPSPAYRA